MSGLSYGAHPNTIYPPTAHAESGRGGEVISEQAEIIPERARNRNATGAAPDWQGRQMLSDENGSRVVRTEDRTVAVGDHCEEECPAGNVRVSSSPSNQQQHTRARSASANRPNALGITH